MAYLVDLKLHIPIPVSKRNIKKELWFQMAEYIRLARKDSQKLADMSVRHYTIFCNMVGMILATADPKYDQTVFMDHVGNLEDG